MSNELIEFEDGELIEAESFNNNFQALKNLIDACDDKITVEYLTELLNIESGSSSGSGSGSSSSSSGNYASATDLATLTTKLREIYYLNSSTNVESGYLINIRDNTNYYTYTKKTGSSSAGTNTYVQTGDTQVHTSTKSGSPTITTEYKYTTINSSNTVVPITNNNFYWIKKTYSDVAKTTLREIEYGGQVNCKISRGATYYFDFQPPTDTDIANNSSKVYEFNFIVKEGTAPGTPDIVGYSAYSPAKFLNANFMPANVLYLSYKAGCTGGAIRVSKDSGSYGCVINWSKKIIL